MGDVRDIKDAAWAAYCKAPTCRDMGRSKVDAAVDSVLAISARAAVPEVRIPVPNDLIEQASRHACTVQGVNPDAKVLHGSDERQWQRLSGTVHAALHYYATTIRNARPVAAAPQPAGEDEPGCDDCDGYEGEGGHCLMCGKDLSPPHEPATSAPADVEALAYELGAKGSPANEQDRLAFEAWMRGHCWSLCATWRDGYYRSDAEAGGGLCPDAMNTRRLWAAWRDRGELARRLLERS